MGAALQIIQGLAVGAKIVSAVREHKRSEKSEELAQNNIQKQEDTQQEADLKIAEATKKERMKLKERRQRFGVRGSGLLFNNNPLGVEQDVLGG